MAVVTAGENHEYRDPVRTHITSPASDKAWVVNFTPAAGSRCRGAAHKTVTFVREFAAIIGYTVA